MDFDVFLVHVGAFSMHVAAIAMHFDAFGCISDAFWSGFELFLKHFWCIFDAF